MAQSSEESQDKFDLADTSTGTQDVGTYKFEPIKGYPMLNWRGKRPFRSTQYYPAQLKEIHGDEVDGWRNKIFWGDNLQVMGHLLKEYRGKVDVIYVDPPFDSKADYKKRISVRGQVTANTYSAFEEKQYGDIWANDDYLQFMYDRLCIFRELLSSNGSLWLHCDWHRSHHLRCILDEIFGPSNLQNEVIWQRTDPHNDAKSRLGWVHDTIFWYAKSRDQVIYNWKDVVTTLSDAALKEYSLIKLADGSIENWRNDGTQTGRRIKLDDCTYKGKDAARRFVWRGTSPSDKRVWPYATSHEMDRAVERGEFYLRDPEKGAARCRVSYLDEREGQLLQTIWTDTGRMKGGVDYPTQKPEDLIERILLASSNPQALVLDMFMGSGTTQAVSTKLGRRFIGADINLGAIQISTKRMIEIAKELRQISLTEDGKRFTGFEVYNVNNYDVFRNPVEARDLLIEALELERLEGLGTYDGEKDGRMWKIMPVNRVASRADLATLAAGFDFKVFERRQKEKPNQAVEKITLVCMGHEPDLMAELQKHAEPYRIDVQVLDILRDKTGLEFKRDSQARLKINKGNLLIERFYPMNLLQKLSIQKEAVSDWRELVESVMIDWNYDSAILQPALVDFPDKNELVQGVYPIPETAGTIRVKITDVLSESWEGQIDA